MHFIQSWTITNHASAVDCEIYSHAREGDEEYPANNTTERGGGAAEHQQAIFMEDIPKELLQNHAQGAFTDAGLDEADQKVQV